MKSFHYLNNTLHVEQVSLIEIAHRFGTPTYVYSKQSLEENWSAFENAFKEFPHQICYAVKANSNLAILNLFAKRNAGFDIVSLGELERVLQAGGLKDKIIFSGVGKQPHEIKKALEIGIGCFNIESDTELDLLEKLAKETDKIAPIALRINPNIDAKTHPYIATGLTENKFGIPIEDISSILTKVKASSHLKLIGVACHIGSQLTNLDPILEALTQLIKLANEIKQQGIILQHINIGGGLGISYHDEHPPTVTDYVQAICNKLAAEPYQIFIEPGRALTAKTGLLLTEILYLKSNTDKNFAIVDAAMNDLIRPVLYDAWHDIKPVNPLSASSTKTYDIVGPICESADCLGKNRQLSIQPHDLLAIMDAGAYGFVMSSNYNSRPRAAEVGVSGTCAQLIRQREKITDLFNLEQITGFEMNTADTHS